MEFLLTFSSRGTAGSPSGPERDTTESAGDKQVSRSVSGLYILWLTYNARNKETCPAQVTRFWARATDRRSPKDPQPLPESMARLTRGTDLPLVIKTLKSLNRTAATKKRRRRSEAMPNDCQIVGRGLLMGVNVTASVDLARRSTAGIIPLYLCRKALPHPRAHPEPEHMSPLITMPTIFQHMGCWEIAEN